MTWLRSLKENLGPRPFITTLQIDSPSATCHSRSLFSQYLTLKYVSFLKPNS